MSDDIQLLCLSHNPPIVSDAVGHTWDTHLTRLRQWIVERDKVVETMQTIIDSESGWPDFGNTHQNAAYWFFYRHPKCELGIKDEYGKRYDLTGALDNSIVHFFSYGQTIPLCEKEDLNEWAMFDCSAIGDVCPNCQKILNRRIR